MKFQLPILLLFLMPGFTYSTTGISREANDTLIIAFGSCSRENNPDQLWEDILKNHPDIWIWLGDNIYGDSHDLKVLEEKYQTQKKHPDYQKLLQSGIPVIGVWDDHDYGVNDGGKNYSMKDESKKLMINFLDIEKNNPIHNHTGVYQSYKYSFENFNLQVILPDTRYFRDTLFRDPDTRAYLPNMEGQVLGEEQWKWLETEIASSRADLLLIGSSIQVLSEKHRFEKWANFPKERERLLHLIKKYPDKRIMILSGDRHIAEISGMDLEGLEYRLYDFTSSGLTHTWRNTSETEPNPYRISQLVISKNFGLIKIPLKTNNRQLIMEIRGPGNQLLEVKVIDF